MSKFQVGRGPNPRRRHTPAAPFKVGDRVRCMDALGTSLKEGAEYTVSSVYLHLIRVQWIRAGLYNASRFEKVARGGRRAVTRSPGLKGVAAPTPEPTPTPHDEVTWLGVTVDALGTALADANASLHAKDDTIRTQGERISELIEALKSANDTVKIQGGEHVRATDGLKLDLVKAHDEIDALQAAIGDLQKELDFYYARLIEKLRTCAPA